MKEEGLTVRQLLKNTYELLAERNHHQRIIFPEPVLTDASVDSDWHRTVYGYMSYSEANLFQFNNSNQAVARGEKAWGYPVEPYDSDIIAFDLPIEERTEEQTRDVLKRGVEESRYFTNSLIVGRVDGRMFSKEESRLGKRLVRMIEPKFAGFVLQKPEYDKRYILASTLQYPVSRDMLYKPEFAVFLAESIEKVLKDENHGDEA